MSEGSSGGERQVPFYCPYCGDQDLRPDGAAGGSWQCASCARAFELRFTAVVRTRQAAAP
jgi:ribosomal protein L37AE/L43A